MDHLEDQIFLEKVIIRLLVLIGPMLRTLSRIPFNTKKVRKDQFGKAPHMEFQLLLRQYMIILEIQLEKMHLFMQNDLKYLKHSISFKLLRKNYLIH